MPKRPFFTAFGAFVIAVLLITGLQLASINAQGGETPALRDAFPVSALIVGPIAYVDQDRFTYADGTVVSYNSRTVGNRAELQPNTQAAVIVLLDGDTLMARFINPSSSMMGGQTTDGISLFVILQKPTITATPPPPIKTPRPGATEDAALPVECSGTLKSPVAVWMAQGFGVSYGELMGWRCRGYNFADVGRAYLIQRAVQLNRGTVKVEQIFSLRSIGGKSWSDIIRSFGLNPADFRRGPVATEDAAPVATRDRPAATKDSTPRQTPRATEDKGGKGDDKGGDSGGKGSDDKGGGKGK